MINLETGRYSLDVHVVGTTNFRYVNFYPPSGRRDINEIDGIRGDLALVSLRKMLNRGVPVVACDGGSSPDFLEALDEFEGKGLTLIPADRITAAGRAPQRRAAFHQAADLYPNKEIIFYYQPEKDLTEFLPFVVRKFLEERVDVALLGRDPGLFEKYYPPYMRRSELRVNRTYNRLMKRLGLMKEEAEFDWFFGPFLFRNDPRVAELFTKQYVLTYQVAQGDPAEWIWSRVGALANPEIFSGSHYFPIIEALFNKMKVIGIEIPYIYPETQRENEMSIDNFATFQVRRTMTASAYLLEALHLVALLRGDERTKIRLEEDTIGEGLTQAI